jgi:hypothetical protein
MIHCLGEIRITVFIAVEDAMSYYETNTCLKTGVLLATIGFPRKKLFIQTHMESADLAVRRGQPVDLWS